METHNKNLPRDVFLYLLSIIALGMLAVNFGTLLFQFINIYFPDAITDQYRYFSTSQYYESVRWAVSSLVIVFPVFLWVSHFLKKDITANPEKRELKVRKWLLYLTLFVAGVVVIGDLIALVYNYLQGELTTRFVLKVLSILAIASSVFYYYLHELREGNTSMKLFGRIAIAVVTAGIIGGFVVAGSPEAQRFNKFDQQRVQDLQSIQWQIVSYWQLKSTLPPTLDALTDDINGFRAPADPETRQPYEYRIASPLTFEICATFKTANDELDYGQSRPMPVEDSYVKGASSWSHDAGRQCFTRTIDPDRFPKPRT